MSVKRYKFAYKFADQFTIDESYVLASDYDALARLCDAFKDLADDLLEDIELQGLHDHPEWHYRKQKAKYRELAGAPPSAAEPTK